MAVANRKAKDQAMAQAMKSAHVERRTGRCAICYNMIPNGLFNPSGWDNHLARCPGPKRRYVPKMGNRKVA